jgi:GBP family porin
MTHKTKLIALALSAAGSCAMAQSVTIYGRVDVGLQRIDNGTKHNNVDSGTYTASRLGFRGTEDLGGGLSALFFMETGIGADVGTAQGGSRFFNRGAYVGLSSKSLGTVTLGRQYVPIFWPFLFADDAGPLRLHGYSAVQSVQRSNFLKVSQAALTTPVANGTLASGAGGIYSVGITSAFENNLVVYKTPSFGGLTITGAVGAPEGYTDAGKVFGANAEYRSGPLYLGAGWNRKTGIVAAPGARQKVSEAVLGGMYSITPQLNLWSNAHSWKFETGASSADLSGHDFMVGASYKTSSGQLWANYARKSVGSCNACDSNGFGLSYHHSLSKRTELYASYGNVSNDTNSANSLNGFTPVSAGGSVRGLAAGIAHQF